MRRESCVAEVLPLAAMVVVECTDVGMITLGKAAMNDGMSSYIYVVYYNAFGTLLLLPYYLFHTYRSDRPPLTFTLLCRFFVLGLIGICILQVCAYAGINYSSPSLAAAMGNLIPAITFLLAIIFRMEKFDLRRDSSQAKSLGTIVAISGAFLMTFYKGPPLSPNHSTHQLLLLTQQSSWALGGLFLAITCLSSSTWNILQTAMVKDYPHEMTVVFFYCCFGTIQCAIFSLILERRPGAWVLQPGIQTIATIYSAVFGGVFRNGVVTWCLRKKGPVYVAMFKPMAMVIALVMGVVFLGETLHLGSVVGAIVVALGFYAVIWGQAKERDMVATSDKDDVVCRVESSGINSPLIQKTVPDV